MSSLFMPCFVLLFAFIYAPSINAQVKKPTSKASNNKANTPKQVSSKRDSTIVPKDSLVRMDVPEIDPMDTVQTRISKNAITKKVSYHAKDSMPYDAVNNIFFLYKEAELEQEDLKLTADFIQLDMSKNLVTSKGSKDSNGVVAGKPVFKQGETEYRADLIKYNIQTKKGYLSEFRTQEGEGYIQGDDVVKSADNNFGIHDAKYTTCNLEDPHYYIGANKIKVIPDNKIVTGPANLVLGDAPTPLVLPFGIFPIKRGQSSGVIVPTYGNAVNRGYFLRDGGYYFGLGEKFDYSVKGTFYANTSWELKNGLRYANRYLYNGSLQFNYSDLKLGESTDLDYVRSKTFLIAWQHATDPKARPGTTFAANVNISSVDPSGSSYLQLNSYNPSNIVTNQLNSTINFGQSFKGGKYNLAATASMSQNTQTRDVIMSFPDITFNVSSFNPFLSKKKATPDKWYENISVNYRTSFKNTLLTKDSILFQSFSQNEFRNFFDTAAKLGVFHEAPIQTSFKLFKFYTLSASVTLNEYWYYQTIRKDTLNGQVVNSRVEQFERAFTYSPRMGLTTRYYGVKNFSKGKIAAVRHVINPTIDFTYTPDYGTSKYGYYESYRDRSGNEVKYSIFEGGVVGGPGRGRQGRIGFGVDNNLELKVRKNKDTVQSEEKVQLFESISLSSDYNIFADSLKLNIFRLNGRTRLFKNVSLNGGATLDPYVNNIVTTNGFKTIRRTNDFYVQSQNKLGLLTDANLGISATFNKDMFKSKNTEKSDEKNKNERRYTDESADEYYDFNVPWNLSVQYSLQYRRFQNLNDPNQTNFNQTINFAGDVNVTKNWKVGYTSGYDIKNKQITFTSLDFIRLLHCWEFKLNWIPIGPRQSFVFTINVKSSLLQDLKQTRRREWQDRTI